MLRVENIGFRGEFSFQKNNKNSNQKAANQTNSIKSKALQAAAILGAATVIIGGIYKHKTSPNTIEKEGRAMLGLSENIKKEGSSVIKKTCAQIDEVKNILLKDKDKVANGLYEIKDDGGNIIRKYSNIGKEGASTLCEYSPQSGKLLRKSEFNADGALKNIKIYAGKKRNYDEIKLSDSVFDKEIMLGVKDYGFMQKAKKYFLFDCDEELQKAQTGIRHFKNSDCARKQIIYDRYGETYLGSKNIRKNIKDGIEQSSRRFIYSNNNMQKAEIGTKTFEGSCFKTKISYERNNNSGNLVKLK